MVTTLTSASIASLRSSLSAKGRSANTVRAYTSDLTEFLTWASWKMEVKQTDFEHLAMTWLNENRKDWAPKTTGRRLTSLKAWARFAKWPTTDLDEYKPPTPARAVAHPIPEGIDGVLRMAEQAKNERQRALVALCGLMGLRVAEALAVTPACFDRDAMTLLVRGKGDKSRVVPVSNRAWAEILPALTDAELESRDTVVGYKDRFARQVLSSLAEKAGLRRHVSSHDLRATFGTAAYDKSLDLRAVQELLGHSSSKTTEGYTGVSLDKMRGAADVA